MKRRYAGVLARNERRYAGVLARNERRYAGVLARNERSQTNADEDVRVPLSASR